MNSKTSGLKRRISERLQFLKLVGYLLETSLIGNLFNRDLILLDTRQGSDSFGFVFKWSLETGPGKLLAKTISGFLLGILKLLTDGDIDSLDGFEAPVE